MNKDMYYTLLTSLPHIDSLFNSKITPISRIQLDRRLSMLSYDDRDILVKVERLMHWSHLDHDVIDSVLIKQSVRDVATLPSEILKEIVNWRLDVRTIVAALRRKAKGMQPPSESQWSYGTKYGHIKRHWSSPTLGLEYAFTWIPKALDSLEKQDYYQLEKVLLEAVWNKLNEVGSYHCFDFEAVVIYLLRWNLVARWTGNNADNAVMIFKKLATAALGDFARELPSAEY